MENKNGSGGKSIEGFFAGKGFYIVLILCVAVIGVSAWTLARGIGTVQGDDLSDTGLANPVEIEPPALEDPVVTDNSSLWEIPEDVQEVMVEAEPSSEVFEEAAQPVVQQEPSRAFVWPIAGEVEKPYSVDALLYDRTMADWRTHSGVDILAPLGERVMAASSGTVLEVREDELYGTTVTIDHGNGLVSSYANLAATPTATAGDAILTGETIGAVGTTALCEAGEPTHLHFEMRQDGETVDPAGYLPSL